MPAAMQTDQSDTAALYKQCGIDDKVWQDDYVSFWHYFSSDLDKSRLAV